MGAENSKPNETKQHKRISFRQESTEDVVQRALERQRQIFESKYVNLINSNTHADSAHSQQLKQNSYGVPGYIGEEHPVQPIYRSQTQNSLYPNLSSVNNNTNITPTQINRSSYYDRPGTSNYTSDTSLSGPPASSSVNKNVNIPLAQINRSSYYDRPGTSSCTFDTSPSAPPASVIEDKRTHLRSRPNTSPSAPSTSVVVDKPTRSRSKPNRKIKNENRTPGVDCVTCSNALGLQIFQCGNGHSSCKACRQCNAKCGICSNLITDMRNITLETTIAEMQIIACDDAKTKCPNSKAGCCLHFQQDEIQNHLKECPFNDIICPLSKIFQHCNWSGKISNLKAHFNNMHPEHCIADVDKEMALFNITDNHKTVHFVNIGPFNFLINIEVNADHKTISIAAQLYGTAVSASKWTFELNVYNKNEPKRKYQYIDILRSNSIAVKDIIDRGDCAVIPVDYANSFVANNRLTYKFYLKKEEKRNRPRCKNTPN